MYADTENSSLDEEKRAYQEDRELRLYFNTSR
jgi:hypothetical protein